MRSYEIVMIFDADLDAEAIRAAADRTVEHIRTGGGEPGTVEHWGKRRFAYEMKHRWEGYYVVVAARAEPATVDELDRSLSLSDDVLRHRVVRLPENIHRRTADTAAEA